MEYSYYYHAPYYRINLDYDHMATSHESVLLASTSVILLLFLLATALSFSYRIIKNLQLPPRRFHQLTKTHAFATEGVQLLVVFVGMYNFLACLAVRHQRFLMDHQTSAGQCFSMVMQCLDVVLRHACAVRGVDLIEARILLGTWDHPYQDRCFVLTRFELQKLVVRWNARQGIREVEERATTVTATMKATPAPARRRSARRVTGRRADDLSHRWQTPYRNLAFLDLALENFGLGRKRRHSWPARRQSSAVITEEDVKLTSIDNGAASLPTPPFSGQRSRPRTGVSIGVPRSRRSHLEGQRRRRVGLDGDGETAKVSVKNVFTRLEGL